jgi:quaternary ammonium compound-resistance protein SugE
MSWIYLILAGFFEVGWAYSMKMHQTSENKVFYIVSTAICLMLSGLFLWLSQKSIPIGTSYIIWTGIGAIGTFTIGVYVFNDNCNIWRVISALVVVLGMVGLKLSEI